MRATETRSAIRGGSAKMSRALQRRAGNVAARDREASKPACGPPGDFLCRRGGFEGIRESQRQTGTVAHAFARRTEGAILVVARRRANSHAAHELSLGVFTALV